MEQKRNLNGGISFPIKRDVATGVADVTAADYEQNLGQNLKSLLDRAKTGR